MDKKAVQVIGASTGYHGTALMRDISFSVSHGEIVTILGGSGCGKSTLLKSMIGLLPLVAGDVLIEGESIVRSDMDAKRRIMRKFGVAFQGGALFRSYTLGENIALPLEEYTALSGKEIRERVREKLAVVGLDGCENKAISELSGGMVKRGAVARALALDPKLIFLDEPSAGLDPVSSANLDRLILDIREKFNAAIVVVTHELDSIFTIADRAVFLDRDAGSMVADGPPMELKNHSHLSSVRLFLNRGNVNGDFSK